MLVQVKYINIKGLLFLLCSMSIIYSSDSAVSRFDREIPEDLVKTYITAKEILDVLDKSVEELGAEKGSVLGRASFSSNSMKSGIMFNCSAEIIRLSTPFGDISSFYKDQCYCELYPKKVRSNLKKKGFSLKFLKNFAERCGCYIYFEVEGVGEVSRKELDAYRGTDKIIIDVVPTDSRFNSSFYEISKNGLTPVVWRQYYDYSHSMDMSSIWEELEKSGIYLKLLKEKEFKKAAWRKLIATGSIGIEPLMGSLPRTTKK